VGDTFRRQGLTLDAIRAALVELRGNQRITSEDPESTFNALEQYGRDLTEQARKGKLDPVIGRDDEIRRVIQVLSRRTKNNPVLIGEPGVGKTAIVEGLAGRIADGDVPEGLKDKRIVASTSARWWPVPSTGASSRSAQGRPRRDQGLRGRDHHLHRRDAHHGRRRRRRRARWTPPTCSSRCSPGASCA
jgi:hypothetical protein